MTALIPSLSCYLDDNPVVPVKSCLAFPTFLAIQAGQFPQSCSSEPGQDFFPKMLQEQQISAVCKAVGHDW